MSDSESDPPRSSLRRRAVNRLISTASRLGDRSGLRTQRAKATVARDHVIIEAQQARNRSQTRAWEDEARARAAATEFLLQGVSRDWLERSMLKMFMQADVNNSGALDTAEFIACLRAPDLARGWLATSRAKAHCLLHLDSFSTKRSAARFPLSE